MSRLTQSQIIEMLITQAEHDRKERHETLKALHALTAAILESKRPTASESVEIDRSGTGQNPTIVKVVAVAQEGETLNDAGTRAADEFERRCARFPLPSGYAHPAPLGDETQPAMPPSLEDQLRGSVEK